MLFVGGIFLAMYGGAGAAFAKVEIEEGASTWRALAVAALWPFYLRSRRS